MFWFALWTALIVGWLTAAFFGLRRLWRQAAALGRELEGLASAAERLTEALDLAPRPDPVPPPDLDAVAARRRLDQLRRRRRDRRDARRRRAREIHREWDRLAGWSL